MKTSVCNLSIMLALGWLGIVAGLVPGVSAETLVIRGAFVHSVVAPGRVADVKVEDGKIVEVAPAISAGSIQVIEAAGSHLFPGLIAATTQLGLMEINSVRATRDTAESGEFTPDVFSWQAVNPDSELIPVARANGITHAIPVPSGGIVGGSSGLIQLTGWTSEEMTVKSPMALHLFWPSSTLQLTPKEQMKDPSKWKSLEEQARERTQRKKKVEDFFDSAEAYVRAFPMPDPSGEGFHPAWEAMRPFVSGDLPVMVHADAFREIKEVLAWAKEKPYRMILAGGRDSWRLAAELAEQSVPVIYEHLYSPPARDRDGYAAQFEGPARLREAGVKVVLSLGLSGFATANVRNLPYAAAQSVAHGLSPADALKSITLWPAEVMGMESSLGSIEPGKEATFFLASGDILDIRSQVERMWIKGQEVSLESRHTRLHEKFKSRPKPNQTP